MRLYSDDYRDGIEVDLGDSNASRAALVMLGVNLEGLTDAGVRAVAKSYAKACAYLPPGADLIYDGMGEVEVRNAKGRLGRVEDFIVDDPAQIELLERQGWYRVEVRVA